MKGMQGGMQNLMKQVNQMQSRVKKVQDELAAKEFKGTSGGGAVTVKVNGANLVLSVHIKDDVIKSGDTEMLQDLILTATNEAIKNAKDATAAEMEKATGGLSLPGLF